MSRDTPRNPRGVVNWETSRMPGEPLNNVIIAKGRHNILGSEYAETKPKPSLLVLFSTKKPLRRGGRSAVFRLLTG